jgi:hypothetical protein
LIEKTILAFRDIRLKIKEYSFLFLDKRQQVPDFKLIKPSKGSTYELIHAAAYSLAKER